MPDSPTGVDLGAARDVLARAVERDAVPGAVGLVRWRGNVLMLQAFGHAALEPVRRPMLVDTVFDLASLTKPLATTGVIMALVERGLISLDDPLDPYLPELAGSLLTARRLLTHTSGLPGWRPTYTWGRSGPDVVRGIAALDLAYAPGIRVEYSDLGFILLGVLAERVAGESLDHLSNRLLFAPLGLASTGYVPAFDADRYAVTERGNAFERAMLERAGDHFGAWRTDFSPGEVNDGNAFYGLGGIAGHAGLFGTAADVGVIGQMWLDGGTYGETRILGRPSVALATRNQTLGLNAPRGLGWQLTAAVAPSRGELDIPASSRRYFPPPQVEGRPSPRASGELLSPRTFGHTGFTGTSIWIDPELELVVVLLTNSTHPSVDTRPIASIRARFANAVAAAVSG